MNNQNKILSPMANIVAIFAFLVSFFLPLAAKAAPLDFATIPLANSPTVRIQPNLLFILDDSGSMASDFMPDWANSGDSFELDSSFNTLQYNPAVRYVPAVNFTSGGLDTTTYQSQTGLSTLTGADSSAKPNWHSVNKDPFLHYEDSSYQADLEALNSNAGPIFWVTIPTEFCVNADLKDCVVQANPTAAHPFPAPIRWCSHPDYASTIITPTTTVGMCQAARVGVYDNLRAPATVGPAGVPVGTVTFTNATSTPRVTGITVSGKQIMSSQTSSTNSLSSLADFTAAKINNCTSSAAGNCTIAGYSAISNGATVSIYAPAATTATPSVGYGSGFLSFTTTAFAVPPAVAGGRIRVNIKPSTTSYPYPGSLIKAGERTDCAGTTCTYAEEMTNYANWYSYYRTRTIVMKTAISLAFKDLGDDFRVGFMTTSTLGARSINFKAFTGTDKANWYAKLFSTPSDRFTPLRGALSTAGRIYANKTTAHGTFTDPIQYECQQNFTLLTTDGFWNTDEETNTYAGGPKNLSGASSVGNMDSLASGTELGKREGTTARSDTLADIAKYYRDTDLRTTGLSNCTGALGNNVCETGTTGLNKKQTMVTLTLGLGTDGTLAYTSDYKTPTGDFAAIKNGTKNWPDPIANTGAERIDDLWHAAVNGDGTYFSANKPSALVKQLQEAIASISVKVGTGAAAATSTLNPISGDNFAYVASYTSGYWIGNLEKREIDTVSGEIKLAPLKCVEDIVSSSSCASPSVVLSDGAGGYNCVTHSATVCDSPGVMDGTDCKVPVPTSCVGEMKNAVQAFTDTRNIKINVGGTLQDFTFANLSAAQQTTFDPLFLQAHLTQWPALTATQQSNVTGDNLVSFLRGRTGFTESSAIADNRVFRKREATLGDLVDSKPAFIGKPTFDYGDPGYQDFKANNASRPKTVYVGANDGMLHAFNADTMEERWAYIPSMVIPNMWKLADTNYSAKHSYFVNGDITISDICIAANCNTANASDWRTILVGGLGSGGRGYYALDITDPLTPKLLWEFDASSSTTKGDKNLGFTYGNPIITKRNVDGKWVVLFTSGYNNIPDNDSFYGLATTDFKPNTASGSPFFTTGDGVGYLYVIDATTGDKLDAISTSVGSLSDPSGIAKIKAYADDAEVNNATTYIYGGDLKGNLWRFNIDSALTNKVFNFAQLMAGSVPQPITTQPELALAANKKVVIVGTGKYLEIEDLTNTDTQSLYAIKDDSATVTLVNPRSTLAQQTIAISATDPDKRESTSSGPAIDFSVSRGWYLDFPDSGERQNVSSQLVLGTLLVPTTVPTSTACQPAGYGWFTYLDYRTGRSVVTTPSSSVVSQRTSAPSVGFNVVYIDGKPKVSNVVADDKNPKLIPDVPFAGSGTGFQLKRSIWREIVD